MIYRIRVILDTEEDVLRDIEIGSKYTLEQFHYAISNAFDFDGTELASFYHTDENWVQGKEIPLEKMETEDNTQEASMASILISELLRLPGDKLLYVYDYLNMWTFYIEVMAIIKPVDGIDYPRLVNGVGGVPKKAPAKNFKGEQVDDLTLDWPEELNLDDDNDFQINWN